MNVNRKAATTRFGRRTAALLAGALALGTAVSVGLAAPASATDWEDDLVVRDNYYVSTQDRYVEARCRVDVYPITAKNLPGLVTVKGKVRCNHRLLAGGVVWFRMGSHDGTTVATGAEMRRIRTGSDPDKNATFSLQVYIDQRQYADAGGSGTWAVRALGLEAYVRTVDQGRWLLIDRASGSVETFRAY